MIRNILLLFGFLTLVPSMSWAQDASGFSVTLSKSISVTKTGWTQVKGYKSVGYQGTFGEATKGMNGAKGEFTVPVTGYYIFSGNVRLDSATAGPDGRHLRLVIGINGSTDVNNGMAVIQGNPRLTTITLSTSGAVYLAKNDKVALWVYSSHDKSYTIQLESNFSGVFVGANVKHGIHADFAKNLDVWYNASNPMGSFRGGGGYWRTSGTKGLFSKGGFNTGTGEYTVPEDGVYYVSGRVRIDKARANMESWIAIHFNRTPENTYGNRVWARNVNSKYYSINIADTMYLKKGATIYLTVKAFGQSSHSSIPAIHTIQSESGFSVLFLGASPDGFRAAKTSNTTRTTTNWGTVTGWKTTPNMRLGVYPTGMHNKRGFNTSTGEYTAPANGYYFVGAHALLNNFALSNLTARLMLDVNNTKQTTAGYQNVILSPTSTRYSLQFSGVVYLKKNDKIKLVIWSYNDRNFIINAETSFNVTFISEPDLDGDNYKASTDCNDSNRRIFPGAVETCDNLDTNCDGQVDNILDLNKACTDSKRKGACQTGKWICRQKQKVCLQTIQPTIETCDGKDNNCDGQVDNIANLNKACTDSTRKGVCTSGKWACVANQKVCKANNQPTAETCDGKDNNCDGLVDNITGLGQVCSDAKRKGVCQAGTWACINNTKTCKQTLQPGTETCDGKDNNCDGLVDNIPDLNKACTDSTRKGACQAGTWVCSSNKKVCQQTNKPSKEVCDGKDNDCDGQVDNIAKLGQVCADSTRKGECQPGKWACVNNQEVCKANLQSKTETCDGKDNDCDGNIDNLPDLNKPCTDTTRKGTCQAGTWVCENNTKTCKQAVQPVAETCDGKDENCDGQIDNILDLGQACTDSTRKGECQAGTWACVNNAKTCKATNPSSPEVCDQKDNDCDGMIDNGTCKPDGGTQPDNPGTGCNPSCANGEVCVKGSCQAHPCKDITCNAGEFCRNGTCYKACGCTKCPKGQSCRQGICQADPCGGVVCAQGEACDPATGKCAANSCDTVTCNANEVCLQGKCIQDPCLLVQCSNQQVCELGQCYDAACVPSKQKPEPPGPGPKPAPDAGTPPPPTNPGVGCTTVPTQGPSGLGLLFALALLVGLRRRKAMH